MACARAGCHADDISVVSRARLRDFTGGLTFAERKAVLIGCLIPLVA